MANLIRPNAARSFVKSDGMLKCPIKEINTINATSPAAGAALPTFAAVVQEFTTGDAVQSDAVCSGTWLEVGDTFCFLMHDSLISTTSE
jgi:hypothetical protein